MALEDRLQSIRESVGVDYVKPDPAQLVTLEDALRENKHAREYLKKRGLSEETIKHFRLGYDTSKDAISIPVFKEKELINIRYRLLNDNNQKYTQERGCETWVFHDEGFNHALNKQGILIVEGEFDLMSCFQAGIKNVVSPASGKDSYGVWIERLDSIPKVYIAYDNDHQGKESARKMSERVGVEKCMEVFYPSGVKDANEFFLSYTKEDFVALLRAAQPFYRYTFQNMGSLIQELREVKEGVITLETVPFVEFQDDWLAVVSGDSNTGKTTYVMNIANELVGRNIPTLVLPFERGIKVVGKRFLQIRHTLRNKDFYHLEESDWKKVIDDAVNLRLYFAHPKHEELTNVISKAKRIFDVKFVIVDHLNYLVRGGSQNQVAEEAQTMLNFKSLAQEHGMVFIIVHHINKPENKNGKPRRPHKEDLKGSSSIYQDPEAVILLHSEDEGVLEVIIEKNKGKKGTKVYNFDEETGVIRRDKSDEAFETY